MNDDDGLPLEPRSSSPPLPTFSTASLRKRSRGYTSSNSSDAPFFSSDDLAEASVDNYVSPRRKRQYRGTWWASDGARGQRRDDARRKLKVAMDSGVFMSSDSSSSNDDGFSVEVLTVASLKRPGKTLFPTVARRTSLHGEDLVRHAIRQCEEEGNETIDLSGHALTSISSATLLPLRNVIRHPKVDRLPQSDAEYQSFAPSLKLYLSSNILRRVPGEIVNIQNLTVLSLRNNKLTELPHSLGKLSNLVELNVSGNKLKWLPWELLNLLSAGGKLVNLHVLPNPLLVPDPAIRSFSSWSFPQTLRQADQNLGEIRHELVQAALEPEKSARHLHLSWLLKIQETLRERMEAFSHSEPSPRTRYSDGRPRAPSYVAWKKEPIYLDSSAVTFYDFDGSVSRHSADPATMLGKSVCPVARAPAAQPPSLGASARVPSLFELALRAYGAHFQLPDRGTLQDECAPTSMIRGFELLRAALDEGETPWRCPTCSVGFVVPRAEWVEYWHCAPDSLQCSGEEIGLPFLRRACCWACAVPGPLQA